MNQIGYWDNATDWVSWSVPHLDPGDYTISARAASPDGGREFTVKIAGQQWFGSTAKTKAWDEFTDVPLGIVHITQPGPSAVEFHPRSAGHWGPTNLSAIRLMPTTHPATQKTDE